MTPSTDRPLLEDLRREFGALAVELREMAAARWELARLEIESDLRSVRRLAIALGLAAVLAMTATPLAAAALAEALARRTGTAPTVWLSGFAGALLLLSLIVGCAAWRRFRRRFLGLRETIEELREDAEWLREKTEGKRRKREMG